MIIIGKVYLNEGMDMHCGIGGSAQGYGFIIIILMRLIISIGKIWVLDYLKIIDFILIKDGSIYTE